MCFALIHVASLQQKTSASLLRYAVGLNQYVTMED